MEALSIWMYTQATLQAYRQLGATTPQDGAQVNVVVELSGRNARPDGLRGCVPCGLFGSEYPVLPILHSDPADGHTVESHHCWRGLGDRSRCRAVPPLLHRPRRKTLVLCWDSGSIREVARQIREVRFLAYSSIGCDAGNP